MFHQWNLENYLIKYFVIKNSVSDLKVTYSKFNFYPIPNSIAFVNKSVNEIPATLACWGMRLSVGVINYQGKTTVLPITEIVSENDFFDYEAKYLGKSQEITPARISPEMTAKVGEIASRAYNILKLKGFSRSEFIIVNNEPYMLEMNTIPGLTTESLIPQQAKVAGISLTDLFTNAIELASK